MLNKHITGLIIREKVKKKMFMACVVRAHTDTDGQMLKVTVHSPDSR
jgi:hypothetical protein